MATLYLVRHGQASFAAENYDRLSELGRRQSVWLGEYFAERGIVFARAVCGTLERQRQTARDILDAMGSTLTAAEHPGWNEYSGDALYKAYLGDKWADARAKGDVRAVYRTIKAALAAWAEGTLQGPLPETWQGFGGRIAAAMKSACADLPDDANVLAATSGGAIGRGIADLLQAPAQTAIELNLQFRNSGFCEVFFSPRSMRLVSFNCVPHLERSDRREAITYS
ncbi:MAG: histidine phosphatase family protein [Betaproteobacteria bacterium]|nr:MAG: histidine phosphatase family protein [Betaproteobacteria bacterium]